MESETVEKYPIQFRADDYNKALDKHNRYLSECENLRVFIKNELGIKVDDLEFKSKTEFEKKILFRFSKKHEKQNLLNLKPFKLAEMLELDLNAIHNAYANVVISEHKQEPAKDDYTLFVTNPEQIKLAKECQELKEQILNLNQKVPNFAVTFNNNMMSPLCYYNGELVLNHLYFSGALSKL